MKLVRHVVLTAGILALGGCTVFDTFSEVDALNEAKPTGSPFTQALAGEYKAFANQQLNEMMDYPDALHFARKGLAAADGEPVMPEPVNDWNLSEAHIKEMGAARGRLVVAYDMGARETAPALAAKAQAKFDCWIEGQEESWQDGNLPCKNEFFTTMNELEPMLQQAPPSTVTAVEPPPMAPEDAMYLVFFNWDSAKLSAGATNVLDAVAQEITKNPPTKVNVYGHADTSGSNDYNQRLGFKRATAVRDALVERGVRAELMQVESRGETELLVPTPDNVREPANRRVNISFE